MTTCQGHCRRNFCIRWMANQMTWKALPTTGFNDSRPDLMFLKLHLFSLILVSVYKPCWCFYHCNYLNHSSRRAWLCSLCQPLAVSGVAMFAELQHLNIIMMGAGETDIETYTLRCCGSQPPQARICRVTVTWLSIIWSLSFLAIREHTGL